MVATKTSSAVTTSATSTFRVVPASRRRHVGSDATRALADWALTELRLERVEIVHSTRNLPACRTAERAGFRVEGAKRRLQRYPDGFHDMHLHSRVRGDR